MNRVIDILESWKGTPYRDGHCRKQVGVDCLRFVDAYLQELHQVKLKPLPVWPPETSLHNGRKVVEMIKMVKARFDFVDVRHPKGFEEAPEGSVLLCKSRRWARRWPGHLMVSDGEAVWHSINLIGVQRVGNFAKQWEVMRAWIPCILL